MSDSKSPRDRFASRLKFVGGVALKAALYKLALWAWDEFNPFQ